MLELFIFFIFIIVPVTIMWYINKLFWEHLGDLKIAPILYIILLLFLSLVFLPKYIDIIASLL